MVEREHESCAATLAARDHAVDGFEVESARLSSLVHELRASAESRAREVSTLTLELNMSRELRDEEARKFQAQMRQLKGKVGEQEALRAELTERLARLERAHASCDETANNNAILLEERAAAIVCLQASLQVMDRKMRYCTYI
jgi:hypothetical protein